MTDVQTAIKQAQEEAARMAASQPQTEAQTPAVIEASVQGGAVVPFSKPSMGAVLASSGVIPRSTPYIKVNEFGIRVGQDKTFLTGFKAKILMVEDKGFVLKHTLRYGTAPVSYVSTYDGITSDKGGSWADTVARVRRTDPAAEPYVAADILIKLDEKVKLANETLEPGKLVALNTSKTNFSEWQDFYAACAEEGVLGQEVDVMIGFREIQHNKNTWGVVTFALR